MAEKSRAAGRREAKATAKFNAAREALEHAMIANKVRVVLLGCKLEASDSLFARLPTVCVHHILDYCRAAPPKKQEAAAAAEGAAVAAAAAVAKTVAANEFHPYKCGFPQKSNKKQDETTAATTTTTTTKPLMSIDEIMKQLYTPGNKIVLPITKPSLHLTAPCWRDFSRRVRSLDGWNVKRIAATAQEKLAYKEYRRGKVYFIHAIYTVPGGAAAKKKRAASKKKKAPPPPPSGAAQANGDDNDNDADDDDDANDCKPSAKKLKTTTTTTTTAAALQQE